MSSGPSNAQISEEVSQAPGANEIMRPPRSLLLAALIVFAITFFLIGNPIAGNYRGFNVLHWQSLKNFTSGTDPQPAGSSGQAFIRTADEDKGSPSALAVSDAIVIPGPTVELQVARGPTPSRERQPMLRLLNESGDELFSIAIPESADPTHWNTWRFAVPKSVTGTRVQFRISQRNASRALAIRDRTDFYGRESALLLQTGTPLHFWILVAVALTVGSLATYLLLSSPLETFSYGKIFLLFLLFSLALQFRTGVYFYWDEWHVLQRYSLLGPHGIIYTHNEHFLPLFFGIFYAEAKIFGDAYLPFIFVSHLIHALNAILLIIFLRALGGQSSAVRRASLLLAALFVCSSLHSETLEWAFEQSVLLSQTVILVGWFAALKFGRRGGLPNLLLAAGCCLVAPLLFGNGFILIVQLAFIGLFVIFESGAPARRDVLKRLSGLFVCCALFAAFAGYEYSSNKESAGHGVEQAERANPLAHLPQIADYVFSGSQLGAVLRGSGLFPLLPIEAPNKLAAYLGIGNDSPEFYFALAGLALSLFLAFGASRDAQRKKQFLTLWLLGELLCMSVLFLPSLGRWQLGVNQSLSLRYHYGTLVGVCIAALPSLILLFETLAEHPSRRKLVAVYLAVFLSTQMVVGRTFGYFTDKGFEHRMYLAQLADWRQKLKELGPTIDYEADSTPLAGAQPVHRDTLTPGRHPNQIYEVLNWLNPAQYPL